MGLRVRGGWELRGERWLGSVEGMGVERGRGVRVESGRVWGWGEGGIKRGSRGGGIEGVERGMGWWWVWVGGG